MRDECLQFRGRKRDLCEGYGIDGRSNPRQEDSDRLRLAHGMEPVVVSEPQAKPLRPVSMPPKKAVSKIGTRLAAIFKDRVGAIPCGSCKDAIEMLNGMTADEVRLIRDVQVKKIAERASAVAQKWWQKIIIEADQFLHLGGTEYLIGKYLDEACDAE